MTSDSGARTGVQTLIPGDPRYCWNPYRHHPHDFHYELLTGTRGDYYCDGFGPAYVGPSQEDYDRVNPAGFYPNGHDAWIHIDAEGKVVSLAEAIARAEAGEKPAGKAGS